MHPILVVVIVNPPALSMDFTKIIYLCFPFVIATLPHCHVSVIFIIIIIVIISPWPCDLLEYRLCFHMKFYLAKVVTLSFTYHIKPDFILFHICNYCEVKLVSKFFMCELAWMKKGNFNWWWMLRENNW